MLPAERQGEFSTRSYYKELMNQNDEHLVNLCELTISRGGTCTLLNSVQKSIETQGWLLLTFFICLQNQLSSFNSIIVQMSEKRDSSNRL